LSNTCNGEPERQKDGSAKVCDPNSNGDQCSSGFACYPNISKSNVVNTCCPVSSDVCFLPMDNGRGLSNLVRWYFDLEKNDCAQFFYKGETGNQNNFESKSSCMKRCVPDANPCGTGLPFRINDRTVQCYNNVSACPSDYYCHHGDDSSTSLCCPSQGEVCDMPMNAGRGADSQSRWFYYREMRRCLPFIYFGIGGNANNFLSQQSCENACL
uniref:BPTI/Kunitz inhibitor domain-containing protein n=1 Tax=Romanomermis culicivorax TaxID=13658 RepID=A0A915KD73_ROMCU